MSTLRSAVDELAREDLRWVPDDRLADDLAEIRAGIEALEGEWLRRLGEFDRRGAWEADGHLSAAGWLRDRLRMAAPGRRVGMARALAEMPGARAALEAGEITTAHLELLAGARKVDVEAYEATEETLVEAASTLAPGDLRRVVDYWTQNLLPEEAETAAEERHRRRRLFLSTTFEGMVRIDGDLDPEGGAVVATALRALCDPVARDPEDDRTPAQRRADALVELCRSSLDRGEVPVTGGERPHLTVLVSLDALERRAGRPCEIEGGGVISTEAARRLACDAGVTRMIVGPGSEPLDVGRRARTIPAGIRRALVVRDGGCVFPGCDRPPEWCDAHHVVPWVRGGRTSLDNLVLLCRRHHRAVHEGGFRLELVEGRPRVRRSDGSVVRGPPEMSYPADTVLADAHQGGRNADRL